MGDNSHSAERRPAMTLEKAQADMRRRLREPKKVKPDTTARDTAIADYFAANSKILPGEIAAHFGLPLNIVHEVLKDKRYRNRMIIQIYHCDPKATLEGIGRMFGITKERVRQIVAAAKV